MEDADTYMTLIQALFSGIIQGLTEFLPVSSSGHLVLLQHLFGLKEQALFFDISLHMGTLAAVVFFFRKEVGSIITAVLRGLALLGGFLLAVVELDRAVEDDVNVVINGLADDLAVLDRAVDRDVVVRHAAAQGTLGYDPVEQCRHGGGRALCDYVDRPGGGGYSASQRTGNDWPDRLRRSRQASPRWCVCRIPTPPSRMKPT